MNNIIYIDILNCVKIIVCIFTQIRKAANFSHDSRIDSVDRVTDAIDIQFYLKNEHSFSIWSFLRLWMGFRFTWPLLQRNLLDTNRHDHFCGLCTNLVRLHLPASQRLHL